MRLHRSVGLTIIYTALGGCAVGSHAPDESVQIDKTWQAPVPRSGVALRDWWSQMHDPVLLKLQTQAVSTSASLEQASAKIRQARATLTSNRADGLPSVDGSASWSRAKQNLAAYGAAGSSISNTKTGQLDASWEIDLFAKNRRQVDAANARVQARIDDWHSSHISLLAEVADDYVQYRGCQALTALYADSATSQADSQRSTQRSVEAGLSSRSDLNQAVASAADARSSLIAQQAECEVLVKALVALVSVDEPTLRQWLAQGPATLPVPVHIQVQQLPADMVRQRPDLVSAQRELTAYWAEVGAAVADRYPSLSLSGSISVSAVEGASSSTAWSFGPTLSLPLFDAGKRKAAVDSAQASYEIQLSSYRQSVRDAVKDVEQALVRLDGAARRAGEARQAADEYQRYFEATDRDWRAGRQSLLTREEAHRSALSAQVTWISLQQNQLSYWIALYKALGGGWQEELALSPIKPSGPTLYSAAADSKED